MSGNQLTRRRFLGILGITAIAGCSAPQSQLPRSRGTPTDNPEEPRRNVTNNQFVDYSSIYDAVIDHVVSIHTVTNGNVNQGTGWVYSSNGAILTNEHLTRGASRIDVGYSTGEWTQADVVGEDPYTDLAILAPDDTGANSGALTLAERLPDIGNQVVAVGNPFGLSDSMSRGIVSGTGRAITSTNGYSIPDVIQTDASLNPGNSGGPLVSMDETVIGIVNAGLGDGVGFAVSWRVVDQVVPMLLETGQYDHTRLGISIIDVNPVLARANDSEVFGVYVNDVEEGAPADGHLQGGTDSTIADGVETPTGGDIIIGIDGEPIPNSDRLSQYLLLHKQPGDTIEVTVIRDNQEYTMSFEIGRRPLPND